MFRGLRAKLKLKKHGFTIRASRERAMSYEVYRLSDGKYEGRILKDRDGWYKEGQRDLWFPNPEEAALWAWGREFL